MTLPKVVIDTNIVSYIMKGQKLAQNYQKHLQGKLLSIAFMTVGELYYGAEKSQWGQQKRKQLETTLRNFVVIPYDHEIARCYAVIVAERERQGKPITCADAWIAACALRHRVPLVTHNAKDFENITDLHVVTEYVEA
jgi:tRNA(fMet)-specific endonuclease VapC